MKLIEKIPATIYTFENEEKTLYSFECREGVVVRISKEEVCFYDDGDLENGPSLSSELGAPQELCSSQVIFEKDLITDIEAIIKDAEAYTLHCQMMNADYSQF